MAAYRKTHLCDVELEGRVTMKESGFTNPGTEILAPVSTPAGKVRGGTGNAGVPTVALCPLCCPQTPAHSPLGPGALSSLMSPPCPLQLGLSICYDLRFPEISLALRRAGAEILTYPSAFTVPTGSAHWEVSSAPSLVPRVAGDTPGGVGSGLSPHPNHAQRRASRGEPCCSQEGQISDERAGFGGI